MKLYKVLNEDGSACHGGKGKWPLPEDGQPGKWLEVKGKLVACQRGLHLCTITQLLGWLGPAIWEAEGEGEHLMQHDKSVWRKARLVRRTPWNERTARLFACDCAERALERERKAGREPDERSWNAISVARRFANGEATEEELAAARAAAWAAGDAARAAERKWQARRLREYMNASRPS